VITVRAGAATDVGSVREVNEDSHYAGRSVWLIADGMGGHAAGDVASRIAVEHFAALDGADRPLHPSDLVQAIATANEQILRYGSAHPHAWGLGTTVTGIALVVVGGARHWAVFNVGDSRVYRWMDGRLSRATVDHSHIEHLVLGGTLTEDEARFHSSRHVITRSLGSNPGPQTDVWVLPPSSGERFVLCSDGLSGEVNDPEIALLTGRTADPQRLADLLVEAAVLHGGRDNVTVVVVDLLSGADDDDAPTTPRTAVTETAAP